jgi:hypothetical protein
MIELGIIKRTEDQLLSEMERHYSQPKGFVGRSICYAIIHDGVRYGSIVGGSATRFLPNRQVIGSLNNGVNNIFFHIESPFGFYPIRNFAQKVLAEYRTAVEIDWFCKFGDLVYWHESLVELPRIGECYHRDGWKEVGVTKRFTCKRGAGVGTDSWTGARHWDTKNLRPKRVFVKISS